MSPVFTFLTILLYGFGFVQPSIWTKSRTQQNDECSQSYLLHDEDSGCLCRVFQQETVCFGRDICLKFPKSLNISTRKFALTFTGIVALQADDFGNFTNLEILEIEGNDRLKLIGNGTFHNLEKLKKLSISGNKILNQFEIDSFSGLIRLQELVLINNNSTEITQITRCLSTEKLPKLEKLELSQSNFVRIGKDAFKPLQHSSLKELNLILCQIEYIDPETFRFLGNLTTLRLGENSFNTTVISDVINRTIAHRIPLQRLNLYSVGFRKQPPRQLMATIGNSNITSLNLARNQFEMLTTYSFPRMENLEILDLRECLIVEISNNTFVDLPSLRILLLSGNRLTTIPDGVLLQQLVYLDLQDNSGQYASKTIDFSLYDKRFVNMRHLENLDLSFNKINAIFNNSFIGLANLRVLGLKNATIFYIANSSFAMMKKLKFLSLENNYFAKSLVVAREAFKGLENLEILLLNGCNLQYLQPEIFKYLENLQHLGLQRNNLVEIHPENLAVFPKLLSLDLSNNQLHSWKIRLFPHNNNLKVVVLNSNKLSSLTRSMWEDFRNLTELELMNNQFICNCTNFQIFQNFGNLHALELLANQTIYCSYPDTSTNTTLNEFYLQSAELCSNPINLLLITSLVVIFITISLISVTLCYYRWYLRYWLFLTRLYLIRKGLLIKKRKNSDKIDSRNCLYDAFVSYSNEDRNFVVRLVGMLENYPPNIKLCVYERDFQVGTLITQNVLDCVKKSRKILLIISNSYAKSQWCRWETQIVENYHLFFNETRDNYETIDDSLILIKLGSINQQLLTPTLKFLLKTRIYLQWDGDVKKQEVFWHKLRQVLAPCGGVVESTHL